jgi:hypothetical protein
MAAIGVGGGSPLERRSVFLAAVGFLVALGIAAELRSSIGTDTGFLLDEAARVLGGARLYANLVEMNPPLIVLVNMAAVLLAWRVGIPEIVAYRLGCFAALFVALGLTGLLLRRLLPDEVALRRAILLLLVFVLFNLSGQDFGEREHLLLMVAVPYLLLTAARARGREIPAPLAVLVGLLAGAGLSLKPHFVLLWLSSEAYLRLSRRVAPRVGTPETWTIAGFLALYAAVMVVWAPEYFYLVRLFAGPYTRFLYDPFWHLLLTGPGAQLTLLALIAFAALRRHARHPELFDVFTLGALVSLVAGAAQQKDLRYHFYPSFALAIMLLGLVARDTRESLGNRVRTVYRVLAVSVLATAVVVVCARNAASLLRLNRDLGQQQLERLLPVVRAHATGQSVYVMSYHIGSAYPLINYSGARSASRFPQLWVFPAAYMDQLQGSRPLRYHDPSEMSPSERYLNEAVFEDLRDQRPKVLVILQPARDLPMNGFRRLDYVAYFGRDPRIASLFDRYQLVANLGDYAVYERIPEGEARAQSPPTVRPATHDIVLAGAAGGARAEVRDPWPLVTLLAFVISTFLAFRAERAARP